MILSDFHTHTVFSDGKNTPEEMVAAAIAAGAEALGISDHACVDFDPGYCMKKEDIPAYLEELSRLREKYRGQITLLRGIEADPASDWDYETYDYVVGSAHYIRVCGRDYCVDNSLEATLHCLNSAFGGDFNGYAEAYFEQIAGVPEKTGANIIGHFDLLTKFAERGAPPDWEHPRFVSAWKAAMDALAGKAALEINTGAMTRGYRTSPYPREEMLRYWHSLGGQIVLSSDAHHTGSLFGEFEAAEALARRCGFTAAGFCGKDGKYYRQF